MKNDQQIQAGNLHNWEEPDPTTDIRIFASWLGLLLVGFGTAMAGYMFYRIGEVILDPRSFETQVDRWEFVIRGRTTDAFPDTYETPEGTIVPPVEERGKGVPRVTPQSDLHSSQSVGRTEEMAQFVGRIGSKSARPAALFLIVLVLAILARIAIAIINAGIRLAGLAGGEREYMKRILHELVNHRNHPGE